MMTIGSIYDTSATTIPVLRYLVAIAKYRHFGKAAAACHVSQPTLSSQIRKWEQKMGVTVFERERSGVVLTTEGKPIVEQAERLLSGLEQLEHTAHEPENPLHGHLRLGIIPTIAPYLLPHILPELEQQLPELRIDFAEQVTAKLLENIHNRSLDLIILAPVKETQELGQRLLYREPFRFLTPKEHPLSTSEAISFDEVRSTRLLLLEEGHCFHDQAADLCRIDADFVPATCRANNLETLRLLVESGYGCTFMPELALRTVNHTRSQIVPLKTQQAKREVLCCWRQNDSRDESFQELCTILEKSVTKVLS